ncbi:hypothetical protein [Massilia sp. YMA4]|uniref:hypothetical protein n=1 Tax=Massilia sp. YMA4 TaxID=1593482 RepID=UPI000DD17C95|nr:hypothetical protein [Massilia sp. YMA4]AXA92753.1 hypothetical protein DPH57_17325 [Massilia sp. YMA4]
MDQHKLRTLVFEKTGVKVDVDDPIFALVALNEAVLAEAVERHVERIDAASAALARQAGASVPPVSEFEPAPAVAAPSATAAARVPERRQLAVALGAAAFGALLVLLGQALLFRPKPVPPVAVPAPLTSAQITAIATGEKFQRVLPRLDAKTRNAVLAEMNKP